MYAVHIQGHMKIINAKMPLVWRGYSEITKYDVSRMGANENIYSQGAKLISRNYIYVEYDTT